MIKRLASDVLVYGASSALARSVGLLLLPLLTRYLSAEEYGAAELLAVSFVLANLILPLEVSQAVARFFGEARGAREREDYAWTAFWFTAAVFAALAVAVLLAPHAAARALLGSEEHAAALRIAVLAMAGQALLYVVQGQLRWALQPVALAVLNVCAAAASLAAAVVWVAYLRGGLAGYMAAQALAAWGVLPLGIVLASRKTTFRLRLRLPVLREMLAFSAPLVLSGAAVYANGYADRWLVKAWLGLDELGLYAAGYRIASIVAVALAGFQLAVSPLIYYHHREPGTPAFVKKAFELFLAVALPAVVVIAALAPELVALLAGAAFAPAAGVVGWLALGIALMNAYVFAPGLSLAKLTGRIAALNLVAGAVNVALAAALLPLIGAAGAALAFLAGAATMAALYFRLGQPHYAVPYRGARYLLAIAAAAGLVGVFSLAPLALAWRLALGLAGALLLAGLVMERPWSLRSEAAVT